MAGVGGGIFILNLTTEDLALNYNVEAEVVSQHGVATRAGDRVILNLSAVDFVASVSTGYAIDGNDLHNSAKLAIVFATGVWVSGRGGIGGAGGDGEWDLEPPGFDISRAGKVGKNGGVAIRLGCDTELLGTGDVERGYGGGGGGTGGATSNSDAHGGGGAGGGAPLGLGGAKGVDVNQGNDDGVAGTAATNTVKGTGGAAGGANAGAGGNGGEQGTAAQNGGAGRVAGGLAGTDGNAIDKQGFVLTVGAGITVTGPIV